MGKRIAHLTSVHRADDTRIYYKACKTLADAGYRVVLVARSPVAQMDDHRIQFVEFDAPSNRVLRIVTAPLRMALVAMQQDADVYHFHDPELILTGLALKLLGKRVIYDVHEDVPAQIAGKSWIPRVFRRPLGYLVRIIHAAVGHVFDQIIVAREDTAKQFPAKRTTLIENFPLSSEFLVQDRSSSMTVPGQSSLALTYVGGISEIRGVREMMKATALVAKRHHVVLELAGPFQPESLRQELEREDDWRFVRYRGYVGRRAMGDMLARSSAGLLIFHPAPNHVTSYPNKLFEYMSAGVPVVASDFAYWEPFIDGTNAGLRVNPLDPKEIAEAILFLVENPEKAEKMGLNGKDAVRQRFNWDSQAAKLIDSYVEILSL